VATAGVLVGRDGPRGGNRTRPSVLGTTFRLETGCSPNLSYPWGMKKPAWCGPWLLIIGNLVSLVTGADLRLRLFRPNVSSVSHRHTARISLRIHQAAAGCDMERGSQGFCPCLLSKPRLAHSVNQHAFGDTYPSLAPDAATCCTSGCWTNRQVAGETPCDPRRRV
jgi:hypothetical protein